MDVDDEKLIEQLKALGDATRLRILRLLPKHPECHKRANVSKLAEALEISQCNASHHLKILYQAGLVKNQKMCRDVFYWTDEEALAGLRQNLSWDEGE